MVMFKKNKKKAIGVPILVIFLILTILIFITVRVKKTSTVSVATITKDSISEISETYEEETYEDKTYTTNTLIVEALDETIFDDYDEIVSVEEVVENIYLVDYETPEDTKQGYEELLESEEIQNVITDHKVYVSDNVNVKSVSSSNKAWGVETTGLGNYATKVNYSKNDKELIVAVLDTGINKEHEAFSIEKTADKLVFDKEYDYVNNDSDVSDDNGHGTSVAGVIAETTSDNVKILSEKVMGSDGTGSLSNVMKAINDIYTSVDIINLSLGASASELSNTDKTVLENFFKKIYDYGTIVVCATGNSNTSVEYPASSQYTLAAAAIDTNSNKATFSNYGDEVDFALPGVGLKLPTYTGNKAYRTVSGTSFSSPFLSAAVAEVKADYNYSNIEDIVDVLKENAEDIGSTGKDKYFGYGSINFNSNMFKKPVIANIEVKDKTWATENTILAYIVSGTNIKSYAISTSTVTPSEWIMLDAYSTTAEIEAETTKNGTNYIWIQDENNAIVKNSIEVQYVDNVNPIINSFIANDITDSGFSLQLSVKDIDSGLSKIEWYYKKSSESTYNTITETCNANKEIDTTYEIYDLESGVEYSAYAEIYDIVGNYMRTENITINTLKEEETINVTIENKTINQATVEVGEETKTSDFSISTSNKNINVTCDSACVVFIINGEEENYSRLSAIETNNENTYEFAFESDNDIEIIVALKGDINLDGNVNIADTMIINRSRLSKTASAYKELTEVQKVIADINGDGTVNIADTMLINRSRLSSTSSAYCALSW